jgi:hypothetical protein
VVGKVDLVGWQFPMAEEGYYFAFFLLEYFGLVVWITGWILKGSEGFVALCWVFDQYAGLLLRFGVVHSELSG